ncbi:MAG TPA: hypothetical protein VK671_05735 [Mucilaginibacter sp.]|jgi:hypothetical protein|nr:hypothetical protein [Mucilaginibacter sp.]
MSYPERKPIYDTYKVIVKNIIDSKVYKEYAQGEIDALNAELLSAFKEISNIMLLDKEWPKSGI